MVKLTTPGYKYPVAVEYPLSGFSSGARATNGQSYVSSSGTTWTDLNSVYPNTNVCLKAFTIQGSVYPALTPTPDIPLAEPDITAPSVTITAPSSSGSFVPGSSIQVTWSANDNIDVTGVDISYSKDQGKTWIPAASNLAKAGTYVLTIPSDASGTFMIRVIAKDSAGNEGSSTRTCTVTSSSQGRVVSGRNSARLPVVRFPPTFTQGTSQSEDTKSTRCINGISWFIPLYSTCPDDDHPCSNPNFDTHLLYSDFSYRQHIIMIHLIIHPILFPSRFHDFGRHMTRGQISVNSGTAITLVCSHEVRGPFHEPWFSSWFLQ